MPNFDLENKIKGIVAGVDEVGRGPLAGPVVAAACVFMDRNIDLAKKLQDSKKLTKKRREELFQAILDEETVFFDYASIDVAIIDEINIFQATKRSMFGALSKLVQKKVVNHVLVDGKFKMLDDYFVETPVIKGDSISVSIAASSIVAKVVRDKYMAELAQKHPEYAWENNSGYGTKKHIEAIKKFGITPHHRKSFEPIKSMVLAAG